MRALFSVEKEGTLAYVDLHDIGAQPDNEDLFELLRKLWTAGAKLSTNDQRAVTSAGGLRPVQL